MPQKGVDQEEDQSSKLNSLRPKKEGWSTLKKKMSLRGAKSAATDASSESLKLSPQDPSETGEYATTGADLKGKMKKGMMSKLKNRFLLIGAHNNSVGIRRNDTESVRTHEASTVTVIEKKPATRMEPVHDEPDIDPANSTRLATYHVSCLAFIYQRDFNNFVEENVPQEKKKYKAIVSQLVGENSKTYTEHFLKADPTKNLRESVHYYNPYLQSLSKCSASGYECEKCKRVCEISACIYEIIARLLPNEHDFSQLNHPTFYRDCLLSLLVRHDHVVLYVLRILRLMCDKGYKSELVNIIETFYEEYDLHGRYVIFSIILQEYNFRSGYSCDTAKELYLFVNTFLKVDAEKDSIKDVLARIRVRSELIGFGNRPRHMTGEVAETLEPLIQTYLDVKKSDEKLITRFLMSTVSDDPDSESIIDIIRKWQADVICESFVSRVAWDVLKYGLDHDEFKAYFKRKCEHDILRTCFGQKMVKTWHGSYKPSKDHSSVSYAEKVSDSRDSETTSPFRMADNLSFSPSLERTKGGRIKKEFMHEGTTITSSKIAFSPTSSDPKESYYSQSQSTIVEGGADAGDKSSIMQTKSSVADGEGAVMERVEGEDGQVSVSTEISESFEGSTVKTTVIKTSSSGVIRETETTELVKTSSGGTPRRSGPLQPGSDSTVESKEESSITTEMGEGKPSDEPSTVKSPVKSPKETSEVPPLPERAEPARSSPPVPVPESPASEKVPPVEPKPAAEEPPKVDVPPEEEQPKPLSNEAEIAAPPLLPGGPPPPPPPPGLPGVPPPPMIGPGGIPLPPPMGGPRMINAAAKKGPPLPKPKNSVRAINLADISRENYERSVWKQIDQLQVFKKYKLDCLDEIFEAVAPISPKKAKKGVDAESNASQRTLLEANRNQNILISARKLNQDPEELAHIIKTLNADQILNEEQLEKLSSIMPTSTEKTSYTEMPADQFENLQLADKILYHLSKIPLVEKRVDLMKNAETMGGHIESNIQDARMIERTIELLKASEGLRAFIEIVLTAANYMKNKSRNAYTGCKIASLKAIAGVKSTKIPNTTMMNVIADILTKQEPALSNFDMQLLAAVDNATKVNVTELTKEAFSHSNYIASLETLLKNPQVQADTFFADAIKGFIETHKQAVNQLNELISSVDKKSAQLIEHFGEDKSTHIGTIFEEFKIVMALYRKAKSDNDTAAVLSRSPASTTPFNPLGPKSTGVKNLNKSFTNLVVDLKKRNAQINTDSATPIAE